MSNDTGSPESERAPEFSRCFFNTTAKQTVLKSQSEVRKAQIIELSVKVIELNHQCSRKTQAIPACFPPALTQGQLSRNGFLTTCMQFFFASNAPCHVASFFLRACLLSADPHQKKVLYALSISPVLLCFLCVYARARSLFLRALPGFR
jgi:hypothetical protein